MLLLTNAAYAVCAKINFTAMEANAYPPNSLLFPDYMLLDGDVTSGRVKYRDACVLRCHSDCARNFLILMAADAP